MAFFVMKKSNHVVIGINMESLNPTESDSFYEIEKDTSNANPNWAIVMTKPHWSTVRWVYDSGTDTFINTGNAPCNKALAAKLLEETKNVIDRYRGQIDLSITTTITSGKYLEWLQYREDLYIAINSSEEYPTLPEKPT